MKHEINQTNTLRVGEIDFNLDSFIEKFVKDKELNNNILKAELVLLPMSNFRNIEGPFFPEANADFYNFLVDNEINAEFCIEEQDYKELALHDESINLGLILINGLMLPVIVNLISDYIKSKRGERKANVNVTIIEKKKGSFREFKYEGDPEQLNGAIKSYFDKEGS